MSKLDEALAKVQDETNKNLKSNYFTNVSEFIIDTLHAAPDYADKILAPGKSVQGSLDFMKSKARKAMSGGCAVISDAEGYKAVCEYYDLPKDMHKVIVLGYLDKKNKEALAGADASMPNGSPALPDLTGGVNLSLDDLL